MFFIVTATNGLPIYEQIVRQVKFAVAGGTLRPGEYVPSVRELAKELAINPNTVARAYRQLQDETILGAVRGSGLEVTADAPARCRSQRTKLIRERLKSVLAEARQSQLDIDDVRQIVEQELSQWSKSLK